MWLDNIGSSFVCNRSGRHCRSQSVQNSIKWINKNELAEAKMATVLFLVSLLIPLKEEWPSGDRQKTSPNVKNRFTISCPLKWMNEKVIQEFEGLSSHSQATSTYMKLLQLCFDGSLRLDISPQLSWTKISSSFFSPSRNQPVISTLLFYHVPTIAPTLKRSHRAYERLPLAMPNGTWVTWRTNTCNEKH